MGNNKINKEELEHMLKQAILFSSDIIDNDLIMDNMGKQVFSNSELGAYNRLSLAKILGAVLAIGTLVFFVYSLNSTPHEKQVLAIISSSDTLSTVKTAKDFRLPEDSDSKLPARALNIEVIKAKSKLTEPIVNTFARTEEKNSTTEAPGNQELENNVPRDASDNESFPILTEEEIKKNEKEKKNIIRIASHVAKDRTKSVVRIPDSKDGKIKDMYFESGEVTNREYRVFLFDLLISGRREEFLKAKPFQNKWINADGVTNFDFLEKEYFSN